MREMVAGTTMMNGELVVDPTKREDDLKTTNPGETATARFMREVMDKLVPGISFTYETSTDFEGEWGLPTLDTSWKVMDQEGGGRRRISYLFYKKGVSTNWVTPYKSAQPLNSKVASLSQDVYRIISNCEKDVPRDEVVKCLDKFCARLKLSGYPIRLAGRIVRNGLLCYSKRLLREKSGGSRIHRPETEGRQQR